MNEQATGGEGGAAAPARFSRDRVLAEMYEGIWAIRPEALSVLLRQVLALGDLSGRAPAGIGAQEGAEAVAKRAGKAPGAIAVLPVHGVISQRAGFFSLLFGGTSTEWLGAQMRALVADPEVGAIVLDVDSPGGSVFGVPELAEEIRALRGRKPIVAVADSIAASGAYWIAAQADQVVVSPSGEVGSIGVFALHADLSGMLAKEGVKATFVQFGENKTLGNPFEPLSERAKEEIQRRVDEYGRQFVRAVSRGRGVTEKEVMDRFGQGLMFGAVDAVRLGLADRVATLGEVLAELWAPASGKGRKAALAREVQRAALG